MKVNAFNNQKSDNCSLMDGSIECCSIRGEKMSKHDLRIVKTKEALHRALLQLLNDKDLGEISITEICKQAKINRGTFYLHYGQIEDVFEEYFKEITLDLANSYKEPYRRAATLNVDELDSSTIRIFHHIEKYKSFYEIIFSRKVPLRYYYMLFDEIDKLFLEDMGQQQEDFNHEMFASYQSNAIIGMIINWYKNGFSYSADYLNDQLVKILNVNRK